MKTLKKLELSPQNFRYDVLHLLYSEFKQIQFSMLKSKIENCKTLYGKSKNGNKEKSLAKIKNLLYYIHPGILDWKHFLQVIKGGFEYWINAMIENSRTQHNLDSDCSTKSKRPQAWIKIKSNQPIRLSLIVIKYHLIYSPFTEGNFLLKSPTTVFNL